MCLAYIFFRQRLSCKPIFVLGTVSFTSNSVPILISIRDL